MTIFGPLRIRGRPGIPVSAGLRPWQLLVREQVGAAWGSRPAIVQPIAVKVRFYVEPGRMKDTDLDNLLKAFFDGLAGTVFRLNPRGNSEWDADDSWIHRIEAEKFSSEETEDLGAEFQIDQLSGT